MQQVAGTRRTPRNAGFTLIELMVAVAIVAVLATIAFPSYQDYVRRGKIADALGELSTQRVRLEQFYQDNRTYGSSTTTCGVAMPASNYFTYTCSWGASGNSQTFTLTAAGRAAGGMEGYTYTIDDANAQRTTAFGGVSMTAACWLKRKGDTC